MAHYGLGFPNVLGAIICTDVRIQASTKHPEQYLDKFFQYLINVQLIVGPDLKIYNVLAEYTESNHDAYIWRNSTVRNRLSKREFLEGQLVSDFGYLLEPCFMTPVMNVTTPVKHLKLCRFLLKVLFLRKQKKKIYNLYIATKHSFFRTKAKYVNRFWRLIKKAFQANLRVKKKKQLLMSDGKKIFYRNAI